MTAQEHHLLELPPPHLLLLLVALLLLGARQQQHQVWEWWLRHRVVWLLLWVERLQELWRGSGKGVCTAATST